MSREYVAIISEGAKTEKQIIENIKRNFWDDEKNQKDIIFLPFKSNIYRLWRTLNEDENETDIIDLLAENDESIEKIISGIGRRFISETYLFFDYDGHAKDYRGDVDAVVKEMIQTFDNETENGKIYVSYPMVEAIKDLKKQDICSRRCSVIAKENIGYKKMVGEVFDFSNLNKLNIEDWYFIICNNLKKSSCIIYSKFEIAPYVEYVNKFNQACIFKYQKSKFIDIDKTVAVLSGFPFFLIDYFGEEFYEDLIKEYDELEDAVICECDRVLNAVKLEGD